MIGMNLRFGASLIAAACLLPVLLTAQSASAGPQIWDRGDILFKKRHGADWTLERHQDRITENVWITRGNIMGIFNIAQENFPTPAQSPVDTEWAFLNNNPLEELTASNFANLQFDPWRTAHGGNPPSTIGQPAVLHLITDDIYINIMFTGWEVGDFGFELGGSNSGGRFSYIRSTRGIPVPGTVAVFMMLALARSRRRR